MRHLKIFCLIIFGLMLISAGCKKDDNNNSGTESSQTDEGTDDSGTTDVAGTDTNGTDDTGSTDDVVTQSDTLRFATFNVAMFGSSEGEMAEKVSKSDNPKFAKVARIIQEIRPDVLALMEFDYDASGMALNDFKANYLEKKFEESGETIVYPFAYQVNSNTGLLSEVDIDGNGSVALPADAYGFGNFEGQYAFALLSKYEIDIANIKTYQEFLWKDMPEALLPTNTDGSNYYSNEAMEVFRLSSKNHIDIPVITSNGKKIHTILAHPTPPVFDDAEDRNGKRNHDEIRLLADYINNESYLKDDKGVNGGLATNEHFVIMGDLNADPVDGDSANNAILQLLNNNNVNQAVCFGEHIPDSNGGAEHNKQNGDEGLPEHDTSFFGLRIDYVLPSATMEVIDSGVFWPASNETYYYLVEDESSSDHLMVWVDVVVE